MPLRKYRGTMCKCACQKLNSGAAMDSNHHHPFHYGTTPFPVVLSGTTGKTTQLPSDLAVHTALFMSKLTSENIAFRLKE